MVNDTEKSLTITGAEGFFTAIDACDGVNCDCDDRLDRCRHNARTAEDTYSRLTAPKIRAGSVPSAGSRYGAACVTAASISILRRQRDG
jgi:hypothetical protein